MKLVKMIFLLLLFGLIITTVNISKAQILFPSDDNSANCVTPNHESGLCIELDQCTDLYQPLQSGNATEKEFSYLRRSHCGYSNKKVMVCCKKESISTTTVTPIQTGGSVLPSPGKCGAGVAEKLHGGNETGLGEFPWMVLIEYTKSGNRKGHNCGGSLINDRYVITAAHCVKAIPANWTLTGVRLGEWDTSTDIDCITDGRGHQECSDPHIDVPVERIIVHENYNINEKSKYNDIALLRLAKKIEFTDWISPICLPLSDYLKTATLDGVTLDVAGWGQTENARTSQIKLKAFVSTYTLNDCNTIYSVHNIVLRNSQLCAGGVKGVDSCRGDSGGPLIGLDNTNISQIHYFLAGIVSFGTTPCGLEGWPAVYTRIGPYVDWIIQNMQS